MSHWNYRVVRSPERDGDYFTIHEVHYHDDGKIASMSTEAISPGGDTLDDLNADINLMLRAFDKPVLDDQPVLDSEDK